MQKIIICDDDISVHTFIKKEIKRTFGDLQEIEFACFTSGQSMLRSGEGKNAYGCFMDIELGDEDGIETAIELCKQNKNIKIFFISNYESLVFKAIHARPVRFIRKKFFEEEILETLNYIKNDYRRQDEKILFNSGKKSIEVSKNKICYLESNGHYINVHCEDDVIRIRGKISEYCETLEKMDFVQIQKGIVINMEYIEKLCRDFIVLKSNEKFNISRERQENVNSFVMKYLRREAE